MIDRKSSKLPAASQSVAMASAPLDQRRTWIGLLLLALVVTGLNALKPLHIDDPVYYFRARQIAAHPLQPFACEIFWDNWPTAAHEDVLATVVPYWLGAGIALFGEQPLLWKLWFFPFSLIFVFSVHALAQRFARSLSLPLTLLLALSPAMLPSWNLMADGPVTALTLAAVAVFLSACERRSWALTLLAGILIGLAQQTKYNAALTLPLIAWWTLVDRKWALGSVCIGAALATFGLIEAAQWAVGGHAPFLWNLSHPFPDARSKFDMALGLVTLMGALNIGVVCLLLAVSRLPAWGTLLSMALVCAGFAAVFVGAHEKVVFNLFGVLVWTAVAAALALCWYRHHRDLSEWTVSSKKFDVFLLGWLVIEVAGYFWIAPFPAARRVLTMVVVTTLMVGRCAELLDPAGARRNVLRVVVGFGVLLGLGYYALDLREAWVRAAGPSAAAQFIRAQDPAARIWYVGHWGFAYYAERDGMKPLVPDHSQLQADDWVVVPTRVDSQQVAFDGLKLVEGLAWDDPVSLATVAGFYSSGTPVEHLATSRTLVQIARAERDHVPQSALSPQQLATWAQTRRDWEGVKYALPSLLRYLEDSDPKIRALMAETLGMLAARAESAAPALKQHLGDPDASARAAAKQALRRIADPELGRSSR